MGESTPGRHAHGYAPGRHAVASGASRRRALWLALGANAGYLVVAFVAALAFGSLALLADSVHMISDVAALGIALVAERLMVTTPSTRHSYGLVRAEVLGGLVNALLLLGASVAIVVVAVGRFGGDVSIDGGWVMVVATAGFVVNAGSVWVVARVDSHSINLRAAFWHLAGDALGSIGALVAGAAVVLWDAVWLDAVVSLLIVGLIGASACALVRDALRVLLEAAPVGLPIDVVEAALAAAPGVEAVHHTHVWSLGSETAALSTHVVLAGEPTLHDAQVRGDALKALLADRFGITHATIELECHDCDARHFHVP